MQLISYPMQNKGFRKIRQQTFLIPYFPEAPLFQTSFQNTLHYTSITRYPAAFKSRFIIACPMAASSKDSE